MEMNSRQWAGEKDTEVDGPKVEAPHDLSPDAIGGAYGISWYEYFKDAVTGEVYKVYCYDGVNKSKSSRPYDEGPQCPHKIPISDCTDCYIDCVTHE